MLQNGYIYIYIRYTALACFSIALWWFCHALCIRNWYQTFLQFHHSRLWCTS